MRCSTQRESYVFNTVWKEVKFSASLKISEQEEDILNKTPIQKYLKEKL